MTDAKPAPRSLALPPVPDRPLLRAPAGYHRKRWIARFLVYLVLSAGSLAMALPFYWMLTSGLKSAREAQAFPPVWVPGIERPDNWREMSFPAKVGVTARQLVTTRYWTERLRWDNYPNAWRLQTREGTPPAASNFSRYFLNSTVVSVTVTVGSLVTSTLAAYALATMTFMGSGAVFFIIIGTLYIPGQILLIPNYITFDWLAGINPLLGRNTYFCLIVPWLTSVFSIFLLRQSFLTLPRDLFDAARIDGAGRLRYLFVVVLPLSKPTLITAAIFNFLGTWNSLLWPLVMAPEPRFRTVEVGLSLFRNEAGDRYDLLMAASTFSVLPIVILFFFLQRFFIAGIARTGLK